MLPLSPHSYWSLLSPRRRYSVSLREPNGLNLRPERQKIQSKLGQNSPYTGCFGPVLIEFLHSYA
jgi:hypothetical protein